MKATAMLLALWSCHTSSPHLPEVHGHVSVGRDIDSKLPRAGTLFVYWLSKAEATQLAGPSLDLTPFAHLLDHLTLIGPVDLSSSSAPYSVTVEPGDIVVSAFLDTHHDAIGSFLSAATAVPGDLTGDAASAVHVETSGTSDIVLTQVMTYPTEADSCAGDRHTLVELDAPEVAGALGNNTHRRACVILPASYATAPERRYPVIYEFPGWGSDDRHMMSQFHHDQIFEAINAEAILVIVDTSTRAGSSYLNDSPRTGAWDRFIATRVVPAIDQRFRTIASREGRATAGLSTGGFGALSFGFRHPELFGVVTTSDPDGPDITQWIFNYPGGKVPAWSLGMLRIEAAAGGAGFFASWGNDWSPDHSALGYALPIDPSSGRPVVAVMEKWRAQGPSMWLDDPHRADAIKNAFANKLCLVVGKTDEFGLYPTLEAFAAKLTRLGIAHELILAEGGHISTDVMDKTYRCAVAKLAAP